MHGLACAPRAPSLCLVSFSFRLSGFGGKELPALPLRSRETRDPTITNRERLTTNNYPSGEAGAATCVPFGFDFVEASEGCAFFGAFSLVPHRYIISISSLFFLSLALTERPKYSSFARPCDIADFFALRTYLFKRTHYSRISLEPIKAAV